MDAFALIMTRAQAMANAWAGYGIAQLVVVLGLIFRWVAASDSHLDCIFAAPAHSKGSGVK